MTVATSQQITEFIDALHDYMQEAGWFMMKPANPGYLKAKRISLYFSDNADDIKELCGQYLHTNDGIKADFDLSMKQIVMSEVWQKIVADYIAEVGQFAGDSRVLLGQDLE